MNIRTAYVSFLLLCGLFSFSNAQTDSSSALVAIDHYTLRIAVDEEHRLLQGEALVKLRLLRDSVSHVRFELDSSATLLSVRDSSNKKIGPVEESPGPGRSQKEVSLLIPDTCKQGDALFIKLAYERKFDTLSALPSFIGDREVALLPGMHDRWWPVLAPQSAPLEDQSAPVVLEATLSSEFGVVSNLEPDSSYASGEKTTWSFAQNTPANLASCFVFCASKDFSQKVIEGADSASRISLYYDPARFSAGLAADVTRQLRDAFTFFSSKTKKKLAGLRMVMIGTDDGKASWYKQQGIIVGRNSLSFADEDTTVLLSSETSRWVYELADNFNIDFPDSLPWLRAGWSKYLAAKFFLAGATGNPEMQRRIRLELLSRTLNFYPSQALGHGLISAKDEKAVFNKGAYFFLMLEYVMGENAFNAVVDSMVRSSAHAPVSLQSFQQLCEWAYGSPLDWFFAQWLNQTGFPELVLSTEIAQTNRGNYSVKATISERGDFFTIPVDIVYSNNVRSITRRVLVSRQDQKFEFSLPFLPVRGELDPNYFLLRWVPRLRLLAHARTSVSFRVFDRDLVNSEREASLLLQLDPNNLTGWNNLALFSLGKLSVLKGDLGKAEEYFRRASAVEASDPTELYSVLSLVRLGNVFEMEGKRDQAMDLYKLCVTLARRKPALYGIALFEAQKFLSKKFESSDDFWCGEY